MSGRTRLHGSGFRYALHYPYMAIWRGINPFFLPCFLRYDHHPPLATPGNLAHHNSTIKPSFPPSDPSTPHNYLDIPWPTPATFLLQLPRPNSTDSPSTSAPEMPTTPQPNPKTSTSAPNSAPHLPFHNRLSSNTRSERTFHLTRFPQGWPLSQ